MLTSLSVGSSGEQLGEKVGLLSPNPNPKPVVFLPTPREGGGLLSLSESSAARSTAPARRAAAGGGTNGPSGEDSGEWTTSAIGTTPSWSAIRAFALSFAPRAGDSRVLGTTPLAFGGWGRALRLPRAATAAGWVEFFSTSRTEREIRGRAARHISHIVPWTFSA